MKLVLCLFRRRNVAVPTTRFITAPGLLLAVCLASAVTTCGGDVVDTAEQQRRAWDHEYNYPAPGAKGK